MSVHAQAETSSAVAHRAQTVLIVDDDLTLVEALEINLRREGYDCLRAHDGAMAINMAIRHNPEIIILDISLPRLPGFDVCRDLRQRGLQSIIIMLSVRTQELDRVMGLELGADDYITKPFSVRELLARIRVHTRNRARPNAILPVYRFGDIEVDFQTYTTQRQGKKVALTHKEFELLRLLVQHHGEVLTRDRLLEAVWGAHAGSTTRTVDNHIMRLRQKLEVEPSAPRYILSIYGEGYKFIG